MTKQATTPEQTGVITDGMLKAAEAIIAASKRGPVIAPATFTDPILVHVLRDGFELAYGTRPRQYKRGDEIMVRPEDVENAGWTGRDGKNTFLERLDEGTWIRRGPFPTWLRSFEEYGGWAWREGRMAAVLKSKKIGDPERRAAAEAEIARYYGPPRGDLLGAAQFYNGTIFNERVAWLEEHVGADE